MAVDGRDLNVVSPQRLDYRVHFFGYENEVAGDRRLPASGWLEVNCGCHSKWAGGANLHALMGDRVSPRNIDLIHASVCLAFGAIVSSIFATSRSTPAG